MLTVSTEERTADGVWCYPLAPHTLSRDQATLYAREAKGTLRFFTATKLIQTRLILVVIIGPGPRAGSHHNREEGVNPFITMCTSSTRQEFRYKSVSLM